MATSSFSKTFVLNGAAVKTIQKQSAVKVSASAAEARVKEGKEALARFSPRSKKS